MENLEKQIDQYRYRQKEKFFKSNGSLLNMSASLNNESSLIKKTQDESNEIQYNISDDNATQNSNKIQYNISDDNATQNSNKISKKRIERPKQNSNSNLIDSKPLYEGSHSKCPRIVQWDSRIEWLLNPDSQASKPIDINSSLECFKTLTDPVSVKPSDLLFLTWNLDGLNDHHLIMRTRAVINIILDQKIDVVFLQEVIQKTLVLLEKELKDIFHIHYPSQSDDKNLSHYFCVIMVSKTKFIDREFKVIPYTTSMQGRHALILDSKVKFVSGNEYILRLINSHLESCTSNSVERCDQFTMCLKFMTEYQGDLVIFGGDLNARDREFKPILKKINDDNLNSNLISSSSSEIVDVWNALGNPEKQKCTWSTGRNDNSIEKGYKLKMRLDRVYTYPIINQSSLPILKPLSISIIGDNPIQDNIYISDHNGIVIVFSP